MILLENIIKIYNKDTDHALTVLDNINLEIKKGQFVSIVGPSGSGKSTLMNMIGCLDVPTKGKCYIDKEEISTMKSDELSDIRNRKIGFIFQKFNLLPKLTAIENVELPLLYRGIKKSDRYRLANDALKKVGLGDRIRHRPNELSGGQQQRVAIARALSLRPPLILADEPTGNLDSKSGKEVIEIIKEMHKAGTTIVLITHDDEVAKIADRVIKIYDGKIIGDVNIINYLGGAI